MEFKQIDIFLLETPGMGLVPADTISFKQSRSVSENRYAKIHFV